jgi:hypothetical protein
MRLWRAACLAAVSWARFIVPHQNCDSILPNSIGPHREMLSPSSHSLAESASCRGGRARSFTKLQQYAQLGRFCEAATPLETYVSYDFVKRKDDPPVRPPHQ